MVHHGKKDEKAVGSRAEVWHGTASHTSGGLTKSKLMKNHSGHIVSRKKHDTAKKEMRLLKHGYGTKKGHFGFVKVAHSKTLSRRSRKNRRRRHRGGFSSNTAHLSPHPISGITKTSGADLQIMSTLY